MARFIVLKVARALIARIIFAIHSIISIWRLYSDTKNIYHWLFALAPISLFLEAAVTILWRHGDEYKWFCPAVFIFLCGSVPPIWFLELSTTIKVVNNQTIQADDGTDHLIAGYLKVLPNLPRQIWLQLIEQSLLVVLILGRWLLPKGKITRDQLSQLLLAYLAISADIIELFNIFSENEIRKSLKLSLVVLTVWSVSLIQFPMVLTTVKSQKARYCWTPKHMDDSLMSSPKQSISRTSSTGQKVWSKFTDMSVWGILSTVVLQDGPFFALRIYLLFWENISSYTMFFFVSKNSLIIMVQLYRLFVICCDSNKDKDKDRLSSMDDENQNLTLNMAEHLPLFQKNGSMHSSISMSKKTMDTSISDHIPMYQKNGSMHSSGGKTMDNSISEAPRLCSSDLEDL